MRFTSQVHLPPSEHVVALTEVERLCEYLTAPGNKDPIGFDLETSGLDVDGLGVEVHYACLADSKRRVAVPVSGDHARNLRPLLRMLKETQSRHCGFNVQFDWHSLYGYQRWKLRRSSPVLLHTCLADGMKLFLHFDEEGEDTYHELGLKARARHYLNLPMNDFDRILHSGGILRAMESDPVKTLDYCTRDAWAHLGIAMLGAEITKNMPWCHECPECGEPMFVHNRSRQTWSCLLHGEIPESASSPLTIWDMHQRWDIPFLHVLSKMQIRGLPVNWSYLEQAVDPLELALQQVLVKFHTETSAALMEAGGDPLCINPNSDAELREFYYGTVDNHGKVVGLGFPVAGKTESGMAGVGRSALEKLLVRHQAPGVRSLLQYKKIKKIISTYVRGLIDHRFEETGRLHGSFRPYANTGRLRSRDPNLQNLPTRALKAALPAAIPSAPKTPEEAAERWGMTVEEAAEELTKPDYHEQKIELNIRDAVEAPPGFVVVCADYSQLEIRLAAILSGDPKLIEVVNSGTDMHCYTASECFHIPYEQLHEMKTWDDGHRLPRFQVLPELLDSPEGVLRPRSRGMDAEEYQQLVVETNQRLRFLRSALAQRREDHLLYVIEESDCLALMNAASQVGAGEALSWVLSVLGMNDKWLKEKRGAAKKCIFGVLYGIGATKLAADVTEENEAKRKDDEEPEIMTFDDAKALIDNLVGPERGLFRVLGQRVKSWHWEVSNLGFVRTGMLRYRHPAGILSGDPARRAQARRQSQNSPVQGSAADVVSRAMLAIDVDQPLKEMGAELLLQVHDELLMQVPEEYGQQCLERMVHLMETSHMLITPVPLTVTGKIAKTWGAAK